MEGNLLTEKQAVEKARACINQTFPDEIISVDRYTAEFETGGFAQTIFEMNTQSWVISFPQGKATQNATDKYLSDILVVIVDAITGEAAWLPRE